jgi:hypothetical protein
MRILTITFYLFGVVYLFFLYDKSTSEKQPDDWETEHGLDPDDGYDYPGTDLSREGYTNIEVYINSLLQHKDTNKISNLKTGFR